MEILSIMNSHEITRKQIHTGTVRSIKRKTYKQVHPSLPPVQHHPPAVVRVRPKNELPQCIEETISDNKKSIEPLSAKTSTTKMNLLWNTSGWIRVYCGPHRHESEYEEPSRMVHVATKATTDDVIRDMDLPLEYTLWIQIGGGSSRRLHNDEWPFSVQEDFLKKLGFSDESRRARLAIDPDIRFLLRFYIGPAEIPMCLGVPKSGNVEILKGLVFPQWRRRSMAIIGSHLYVYPGNKHLTPEIFELSGADIIEHPPSYNRLILKIVPKIGFSADEHNVKDVPNIKSESPIARPPSSLYGSTCSISSNSEQHRVLFFGFEESWERDLWCTWLVEATTEAADQSRMDIGGSGLHTIPEIVLQSTEKVEELLAGQNKLQEIGLRALAEFPHLKILRLPGNDFKAFPETLFDIRALTVLDLADNSIQKLPDEISHLENLEELRIDRNELKELPNSIRRLKNLKSLYVSQNQLNKLPPFLLKMKTLGLVDMYSQRTELSKMAKVHEMHDNSGQNPPLTKVSLRANQLKGSIILGNYGHLTQLDVSENHIEILDLSALDQLESLQCSRNNLCELIVNGRLLTSLIAGNNNLTKLEVTPVPKNLRHLDVSFNSLTQLPEWLGGCHQLRTLFASNNQLTSLPDHLFCSESSSLHTLMLGYNKLVALPSMPRRKVPLQELFLQSNAIEDLPENFFYACEHLILLNVSSNRLLTLPIIDGTQCQLERLYATSNCLTDRVLDTLTCLRSLKVLHASYNRLTTFPESCFSNWPDLEEIVLSGNRLQHLPENLANLQSLRILRVHSNQLQSVPALARTTTLRVLDLAHNQLDKINLVTLVPKKLQFLDLSCNLQLQVDPDQLQVCKSQRPMSLVDVSGKNRPSLPSTPALYQENTDYEPPWKVGFSETPGNSSKLYISQLRLPGFCNSEGLFGMFDGELNNLVPSVLVKIIPKVLLEERTVKETAGDYMKYTLLSAHRELKQQGQKQGVSATLCHISRGKAPIEFGNNNQPRRFILRVASVGDTAAVLVRHSGNVKLTPSSPKRQIGNSASFPLTIPDPEICEVTLGDQDEYLVIANKRLWEVMDVDLIASEIRKEKHVILAAKRVQDIAQSYGADENLSVLIVKFNNLGTDVDFLMRELRQTIKKKPTQAFCKCGCCCESNNSCCHSGAAMQFVRQSSDRSDRSSPSGQSDQTASELGTSIRLKQLDSSTVASRKSSNYLTNERRSLRGGVVRAVRAKIEEDREREREESDSALSEQEQFKCWEYMLEQNTQLLFDKELNTISKAFTKKANSTSNLLRPQIKALSSSSPQLALDDHNPKPVLSHHLQNGNVPFLSRHFGSARSFQPPTPGIFKGIRFNSNRVQPINGGPNAAYFGSLQRLMPYNLEYDFAMTQEKVSEGEEEMDADTRMHQYWGVATTEL